MSNEGGGRALSAAIRVALGAFVLSGCGGTVNREPGHEGDGPQDVSLGTAGSSAASCGGSRTPEPTPTPHPLEGCKEKLRAAFGDDAGADFWNPQGQRSKDPALVACCDAIGQSEDPRATQHFRDVGCCKVDVASNGAHCTPWGPPAPPVFVRLVAHRAEVA